jgi:hypothetical protein
LLAYLRRPRAAARWRAAVVPGAPRGAAGAGPADVGPAAPPRVLA